MRLIDADALKSALVELTHGEQRMIGSGDVLDIIDEAETVDAITLIPMDGKREHGINDGKNAVWESLRHIRGLYSHPLSENYRCSLCGYEIYTVLQSPPEYCPRCGAKMDEQEEDKDG